jgi:hypothetical protein
MLFNLSRLALYLKQPQRALRILPTLSHPDPENRPQKATIRVTPEKHAISEFGDVEVVRVAVKREDGKEASFYVSSEGSFRVIQAVLFDGSVWSLKHATRGP